jgi:hypothetical protein
MTKNEVEEMMKGGRPYVEKGYHDPLMELTCVFEDDSEDTEVSFACPVWWLVSYMRNNNNEKWWCESSLQEWLENEYTSDDSREILEQALLEGYVVLWQIR